MRVQENNKDLSYGRKLFSTTKDMIAFLTQYVYGLGHSNRTKLIAEETAKYHDVLIIEAVFRPPLNYNVPVDKVF